MPYCVLTTLNLPNSITIYLTSFLSLSHPQPCSPLVTTVLLSISMGIENKRQQTNKQANKPHRYKSIVAPRGSKVPEIECASHIRGLMRSGEHLEHPGGQDRAGSRVRVSFAAQGYFTVKITIQERADTGQYLDAVQGLRWGQDGDILEGVLGLL